MIISLLVSHSQHYNGGPLNVDILVQVYSTVGKFSERSLLLEFCMPMYPSA